MEPETALTILGGAIGSAKLLEKLLGPTADYLGGELRDYTEKGVGNLSRIFQHAAKTLGGRLEETGQVPPRVLKGILEEGYFCEDELTARYFGGVLASSRTGVARDDRAASFVTLIGRLSTYQVRSHFIFYSVFRSTCSGQLVELGTDRVRDRLKLYIPMDEYVEAMDFQKGENPDALLTHVIHGLHQETLIGPYFGTGTKEVLVESQRIEVPSAGIVFSSSAVGLLLYLWAHGRGDTPLASFLLEELPSTELPGLILPSHGKCYGL